MDHSGSEATFDEAIARELVRHSSEPQAERSLDDALADLACKCWKKAGPLTDPTTVVSPAIAKLRQRAANPKTHRLQWAVWLMAQQLFETSVYDPARRCVGECEKKPKDAAPSWHCPAANDPMHSACAESLVFPYRHRTHDKDGNTWGVGNQAKAATAIARGFACSGINRTGIHLTVDAARKILAGFPKFH